MRERALLLGVAPRRGRRRRRTRARVSVSCDSTAITVCAVPSARSHSGAVRVVAQRVDVVQPDRVQLAARQALGDRRRRRGRARPASRSPGRGRGRSRPRAGRGRSACAGSVEQARAGDARQVQPRRRCSAARGPALPRQRALAVDDHDLLAGGAQRVGELADRGGVRAGRAGRAAEVAGVAGQRGVERDQEALAAAGREAQRRRWRSGRARSGGRRRRRPWCRGGGRPCGSAGPRPAPRRSGRSRPAARCARTRGRARSPAASGRPARAARRAAARRRCGRSGGWSRGRRAAAARPHLQQERLLVGRRAAGQGAARGRPPS